MNRVPTVEEIYQEYHKQTIFAMKGFYPRPVKNFNKVLTKEKTELLNRFKQFIIRNMDMVDWKLYIKACAQFYKRNFDLKQLGSLFGTKLYRSYIAREKLVSAELTSDQVYDEIISSLKFITEYAKENGITLGEYLQDRSSVIPITLKHIYAGLVSPYLYACLDISLHFSIFSDIPDDVFFELFKCGRNDFIQNFITFKRDRVIRNAKVMTKINTINDKFKESFQ